MTTNSIQKLEDRLRSMVGRTYLVNAVAHKFLSFRIDDDKITVVSDKKWFPPIIIENSSRFLETFLETDDEPSTLPATVMAQPAVLQVSSELKTIMMDNIRKVQENKEYIPQAQAICNQMKTLIDLAKTELAYNRMLKGQQ